MEILLLCVARILQNPVPLSTISLTLEELYDENGHVATGDAGLGQLYVVVSLLAGLKEGHQSEDVVRQSQNVRHSTLTWTQQEYLLTATHPHKKPGFFV